ncbi:hypothetical protein CDAR_440141 [Caerostris darwini]|uniref:Uncharacterized protein n=1 Tax=Caerostris darwini TaxID=1538125 RepID=A0AAV4RM46_9ARAC|nr:hypothetical protein CDAR_440141 [Caerostris darwini]
MGVADSSGLMPSTSALFPRFRKRSFSCSFFFGIQFMMWVETDLFDHERTGLPFAWRRGPNKLFDIVNSSLNILGPPPFEESKICLAFNRRLPNVSIVIADRFGPRAYPFARTWPSQTRLITTRLARKVSTCSLEGNIALLYRSLLLSNMK